MLLAAGALSYFAVGREPYLATVAASVTAVAVLTFLARSRLVLHLAFAALLCFALGMLFAKLETMRAGTKVLGGEISTRLTGRVAVIEHQANGRIRMTIDVLGTERPKLKYVPQRVRVSARAIPDGLKAGDVVTGVARLGPPSGPTRPGGYDFSFNSYFDGIGANGFFLTGPELAAGRRRCRRRRTSSPPSRICAPTLPTTSAAKSAGPRARSRQRSSPASGPAFPKTSTKRCGAPGSPTSCRSPACTWRWSRRRS